MCFGFVFFSQKVCSCNHNFVMTVHSDDPSAVCSWSVAGPVAEAVCEMPAPTAWWCYPQVPFCTWGIASAFGRKAKLHPHLDRENRRWGLWRQVGRRGQAGEWGRCRTKRGWGMVFCHSNYLMTCALCYQSWLLHENVFLMKIWPLCDPQRVGLFCGQASLAVKHMRCIQLLVALSPWRTQHMCK